VNLNLGDPLTRRQSGGHYHVIKQLTKELWDGDRIKMTVDEVIEKVSPLSDPRKKILVTKEMLYGVQVGKDSNSQSRRISLYANLIKMLEGYFFLICFCAYLEEQFPRHLPLPFSLWMQERLSIYFLMNQFDVSEWHTSADLLRFKKRVLVSDHWQCISLSECHKCVIDPS
ncbi:Paladin, partial [Cichlidogyrus casuarinus]